MVYLKRNKSAQKRYVPEEYFKKCGYKYDPVEPSSFTQKQLHKLVKLQNQPMWKDEDPANGKRFNEALNYDVKSDVKSNLHHNNSATNLSKLGSLKKGNLDKLSSRHSEMKMGKVPSKMILSSQRAKLNQNSKKESSIRTA